jgi:hypothetical protein
MNLYGMKNVKLYIVSCTQLYVLYTMELDVWDNNSYGYIPISVKVEEQNWILCTKI